MIKFRIAGVTYRPIECQVRAKKLEEGHMLDLIPEPTNEFDPNAIKVVDYQHGNLHLGYVPAVKCKEVKALMDDAPQYLCTALGENLYCSIEAIDPL